MTEPHNSRAVEHTPWADPRARPYIRIDKVTKKFGAFVAVNKLSLDIYHKELFCLLGASGCGKTTLLRLLAGLDAPDAGRIYIDDVDMTDVPPHQRPVNMMFQSYALFPHMTVLENIAFGLKQERCPRAQIQARVEAMLDLLKLSNFARRKPHQLSGGQQQRVALARSLVKQPKLLLLDEPLAALDRKLRESTQFELMKIQDTLGVTIIVVTHDQEEAMTLASRLSVMDGGQIVQTGTPNDVYEFPANRFVADFIGSVNVFEGQITDQDSDGVRIRAVDAGCTLFINHALAASPGTQLWVAVRPEKILISRETPADTRENCVSGSVEGIAYMGDISVFKIKLASGMTLKVTRPNFVRHAEDRINCHDRVWLSWHAASGVVLSA